jgi:hypothetical protein
VSWLFFLFVAFSGLYHAEAVSAHFALTPSEVRYAIGGVLLGLPIALAISSVEGRLTATRRRFGRY